MKKGLAINDRILIEVVTKEECTNLKIDIINREEIAAPKWTGTATRRGQPTRRAAPQAPQKKENDLVAVRINVDYQYNRIVQKSFITKEWSKRAETVNNPKNFDFSRSPFESTFLFVDLKASEFQFGVVKNDKEYVLSKYAHSKHNIALFKLNCIRISGVSIKLKDLVISSQELVHMDSNQAGDETEARKRSYTLKQLIRQLHISQPVENVMSLIGKRYPSSFEEFVQMKLPGLYDSDRAGKRMKLPTPETWETQISLHGNKAAIWEKLIDNKKLPYMAMLRNLRNMIKCGISEKHHQWVIKKLQDEGAVIYSKQFPFRFFTAYSVLDELEEEFNQYMKWSATEQPVQRPVRGRKAAKDSKSFKDMNYDLEILKRYKTALDNALKVATTFNVAPIKGSTIILLNLSQIMDKIDPNKMARGLGKRVTSVSEIAALLALMFKYSCENSKLVVFANSLTYANFKLDEGTILENMKSLIEFKNMKPEKSELLNYPKKILTEILEKKELYDNLVVLSNGIREHVGFQQEFLRKYRSLVNENLLFVNVNLASDECQIVRNEDFDHENDINISGFSDSILRFVAQRGNQGQLIHIENIEKSYDIQPVKAENRSSQEEDHLKSFETKINLIERPKLKQYVALKEWRTVKVFISSTFRDMHSERDLLSKTIFPLLRSKLSKYMINIYDIDLRWGITESDGNQTLDLCLNQVLDSEYFLGIVGERYGQVVMDYSVRKNAALEWLKSFPVGASITELEIETKMRRDDQSSDEKLSTAFFYFRDHNSFINDVPMEVRSHFEEEQFESRVKLDRLKSRLRKTPYEILEGYKCKWLKLDQSNRALLTNLDAFGVRVFNNLYNSITKRFQEKISLVELDENTHLNGLMDIYVKSAAEGFVGRESVLKRFDKLIEETKYVQVGSSSSEAFKSLAKERNSVVNILLVLGEAGCGKTAFISHYITNQNSLDEVFIHSVGAYPNSQYTTMFLKRFSVKINRQYGLGADETALIESNDYDFHKKTFSTILQKLDEILFERKFYIIVDGIDELVDENGVPDQSFSWLPESKIPTKFVFVFTMRSNSSSRHALGKIASSNKSVNNVKITNFELESFDILDKSAFVRAQLAKFNKYLDENPFNNQMKLLTGKRESNDPLYLTLACEELRLHGHFESLNAKIKELPIKVNKLIDYVLDRLRDDYGEVFFDAAFMFICCSRDGLEEQELKDLLNLYFSWNSSQDALETCSSFFDLDKELVKKVLSARKIVTTKKFLSFVESISATFLKARTGNSSRLAIKKNVLIENALNSRFSGLSNPSVKLVHRVMAFYYWTQIDENLDKNWTNANLTSYTYLPYHLIFADLRNDLTSLLCDFMFLYTKCENDLAAELADDYDFHEASKSKCLLSEKNVFAKKITSTFKSKHSQQTSNDLSQQISANFTTYKLFIMSNYHILVKTPGLLFQQAMNQPETSIVSKDLRSLLKTNPKINNCNIFEWVNKSNESESYNLLPTKLTDFDDAVSCVCISSDGQTVACGTENCEIKLFSTSTAKFLRKLHGHSDKINSLVFIDAKTLCSTSSDGYACVWNAEEGFRIKVLNKHNSHVVSDCCAVEKSGKNLVTVGWDCTAKIWNPFEGTVVGELKHPRPVNCIVSHPDGGQIVTGCWDSCIRIFNFFDRARKAVLRGHQTSIRSISFSSNAVYIASSSIDGDVKLWSSRNGAQIATLRGHSMPVNSVCFSPRNQFLITGSSDRSVKIWPGSVGRMIKKIEQTNEPITSVCFEQQKGMLVAVGTHSGEIRIYEIYGGVMKFKIKAHKAVVRRLKFSPDGKYLVSGSEDSLTKVFNVSAQLTLIAELSPKNSSMPITAIDINRQNLILTCSEDCSVYLYSDVIEQHDGQTTTAVSKHNPFIRLDSHKSPITACSFNEMGNRFATASKDATIIVWEYSYSSESAKEVYSIPQAHLDWINDLAWSATSDFILSASNDLTLKIWKAQDGVEKAKLVGHTATINSCAFKYGCAVSASLDGTVKIWSHRGHEITTLYGHRGKINSCDLFVKLRPKLSVEIDREESEPMEIGSLWAEQVELEQIREMQKAFESKRNNEFDVEDVYLVSGGDDHSVRIWKPIESSCLASLENHNDKVNSVDLSRDDWLASASSDRTVCLNNVKEFFAHFEEAALTADRKSKSHLSEITSLKLSETKEILISGSLDGMVFIWRVEAGFSGLTHLLDFKAHDQFCNSICVISETIERGGNRRLRFVTCSNDEPLKLWEMKTDNGQPSIELVNILDRKSISRNVFAEKLTINNQDYLVVVEVLHDRMLIKLHTISNDGSVKLSANGCSLIGETSLIGNITLSEQFLYISLLHDEILEVNLEQSLKKMGVIVKQSPKPTDSVVLTRLTSGNIAKGSNETWFTSVERSAQVLYAADWQGNVYDKQINGALKLVKKINTARTTEMRSLRYPQSVEKRLVSCDKEGTLKIWTDNFETQLGLYKSTIEITKLVSFIDEKSNNRACFIFGDKSGNLSLLKWYE